MITLTQSLCLCSGQTRTIKYTHKQWSSLDVVLVHVPALVIKLARLELIQLAKVNTIPGETSVQGA